MARRFSSYNPYYSRFNRARQFLTEFDPNILATPEITEQALNGFVKKQIKRCRREKLLQHICECLMVRYNRGVFDDGYEGIIQIIEHSMHSDNASENLWAILLAKLIMLHMGDSKYMCTALNPTLISIITDPTKNTFFRGKCCTTLGLINFLGGDNLEELYELMKILEGVFSVNYCRDGVPPITVPPADNSLHTAALGAWSLLLTLVPPMDLNGWDGKEHKLLPSIKNLESLLKSPHYNVRTAGAELLALLVECGRMTDSTFLDEYRMSLSVPIRKLALDEQEIEPNAQTNILADIVHFLINDTPLTLKVTIGSECIPIKTWTLYHYYAAIWNVVGPGMNSHLRYNVVIRDLLQLDPNVDSDNIDSDEPLRLLKFMQYLALYKTPDGMTPPYLS